MFRSGAEDEPRAGIGAQEFVRYFGLGHLVERLTSAVQCSAVQCSAVQCSAVE
jgi:hypothetical protein